MIQFHDNLINNWILSENLPVGSCWLDCRLPWYPGWCQPAVKVWSRHWMMSRLAGNVPGVDHQTIRLSQEAATNSPNISQYESLSRTSLIPALSQLYPIFIGSIYRLLLWRDNVKYHGSTRWSIIFSPLINYTECQTITGVLWDSIGLYVDCKSSFLLRKTKIIYNLPTITLEAAYHDVLYLISFFYHQ